MPEIKRLFYFRHQFLNEKDFLDEQKYHISMRRRLNQSLYSEGIVTGLQVEKRGEREVTVSPGLAIDREGREIVLTEPAHREVSSLRPANHAYIVISYDESYDETDRHSSTGVEGYTRVTESPNVRAEVHHPGDEGNVIVLARVHLHENGNVREIDESVRRYGGPRLGPGAIRGDVLADGSVTAAKLSPTLRRQSGWLRLPFKPIGEINRPTFAIGPTEAVCGREGATGSMGIPSPPGAVRITGFRIAGEVNEAGMTIEVYKCGWDPARQDHEKRTILEQRFQERKSDTGRTPFEENRSLEEDLDPEHHALSVRVIAAGRTSISLIAIRFEYEFRELEPKR